MTKSPTDMQDSAETLPRFEIDFLEAYDDESILAELRRLAAELGKPNVSSTDLNQFGRVTYHAVLNHFGSLRNALERAGLRPSRCMNAGDEELIRLLAGLWRITKQDLSRRPHVIDLTTYKIPVSAQTVVKRFGSWKKALIATAKASSDELAMGDRVSSIRRPIPVSKRFLVLKRDRYRCRICNRSGVELEVDHIVPVSHGGSDRMDNLQTACQDCNRGKGDRLQ